MDWAGSDEYAEPQVGGRTIGGMMPRPDGMPAEAPDSWTVYFGSTDVDAETKKGKSSVPACSLTRPTSPGPAASPC